MATGRDKAALIAQVAPHRGVRPRPPGVTPEPIGPGEESVWDFPRPPEVQDVGSELRVVFAGQEVARTSRGRRVIETAGAPVYYFPPEDVLDGALRLVAGGSICEWKGVAAYFDLVVADKTAREAAFCYPDPFDDLGQGYDGIAGWIAFYANRVDAAFIGAEQVAPQPGGFYAGWVTATLRGPIKGAPGSQAW